MIIENKRLRELGFKRINEIQPETKEFTFFINRFKSLLESEYDFEFVVVNDFPITTICNRLKIKEGFISNSYRFISEKFRLSITPYENGVHIHILEVNPLYRKCGIGHTIMTLVQEISNEINIPVYLIPLPIGGQVELEVLERFYGNLGYEKLNNSHYWRYESQKSSFRKVS